MDLQDYRRYFAEEIHVVANLSSPLVVEALATVSRDVFLPPGPWTIRGEADLQAPPRQTPDADPRHVHHNVAVAIDPARLLFNGVPSLLAMAIDVLKIQPGHRVLHLGTGLGYYTAIIANCVGPTGRVLGIEVDADLAVGARSNLADRRWVEVRHGNGAEPFDETFDAILINAGVTHPLTGWMDALAPDGRIILPLTATMPAMTTIGKGPMVLMNKTGHTKWTARVVGFVAIYSALELRDDERNTLLGQALTQAPLAPITSARLESHDPSPSCWLHTPGFCLSLE